MPPQSVEVVEQKRPTHRPITPIEQSFASNSQYSGKGMACQIGQDEDWRLSREMFKKELGDLDAQDINLDNRPASAHTLSCKEEPEPSHARESSAEVEESPDLRSVEAAPA